MIIRGTHRARASRLGRGGRAGPLVAAGLVAGLAGCGPKPLVVTGAGVIDGTGAVWENGRVVVIEERVVCVGSVEDCDVPPGAQVLDAEGFWVTPGLIDVNAGIDEGPSDEQSSYLALLLGVTTIAVPEGETDLGGEPSLPTASDDRRIPAPRPALADPTASLPFPLALRAAGATEASPTDPRDARAYGVWFRSSWLEADAAVLRDSARAMGARGLSFAPRLLEQELWAGPYRLPHGLHPLLEHPLVTRRIQDRILPDRTEAEATRLRTAVDVLRRFVRDFHEAGGSVVTATGGVLAPGLSMHEEMDALVEAGLSPEEALYAATREAAISLGIDDSRGTLEVGKLGDLLILEGDPRLDIAHTQTISRVVKGGVLYDPPTLFDSLLDSPGSRVSNNPLRVVVGTAALLITLLCLWLAVVHHRRALPPRIVH